MLEDVQNIRIFLDTPSALLIYAMYHLYLGHMGAQSLLKCFSAIYSCNQKTKLARLICASCEACFLYTPKKSNKHNREVISGKQEFFDRCGFFIVSYK